jgi:uncharacterized membrane protein YfcA
MITRNVSIPQIGLIAGTRALIGAGIGLLVADHIKPDQRRAVGWTLLTVGILTTIPLAADLLFGHGSTNGDDKCRSEGATMRR